MNNDTGYLTDQNGKPSNMRIMSVSALVGSFLFGIMAINMESENGMYLSAMYLLAAFAPKALQSFAEKNIGKVGKSETV